MDKPKVIEEFSVKDILDRLLDDLKALDLKERDPAYGILSAVAYREALIRQLINEGVRSTLLSYSKFRDDLTPIKKQKDESLEQWIERVITARKGSSLAGPNDGYRALTLSVAPKLLKDVAVFRRRAGVVRIVLLTKDPKGEPSKELIAQVNALISEEGNKVTTDTIEIGGPTLKPVSIKAKIKLYPDTPISTFKNLEGLFRAEFEKQRIFGRDITQSWVSKSLHVDGVYSVDLDGFKTVEVKAFEAPFISSLELELVGRDV